MSVRNRPLQGARRSYPRDTAVTSTRSAGPDRQGLRSPGWFAAWPVLGILLFLAGTLAFGAIAYNVQGQGPLVQLDKSVYRDMYARASSASPLTMEIMDFGFFWGKELILVALPFVALYFLHKRYWQELAMLLVGSGGSSLIWRVLNTWFDRPRPPAQLGIVVTNPSFPSGHTASALLFYGLLAYLIIPRMPSAFWKWLAGLTALGAILFTGVSRVYLGGHYLSDVLAGYAQGIAWAGLCYTLIEKFFSQRRMNHVKER